MENVPKKKFVGDQAWCGNYERNLGSWTRSSLRPAWNLLRLTKITFIRLHAKSRRLRWVNERKALILYCHFLAWFLIPFPIQKTRLMKSKALILYGHFLVPFRKQKTRFDWAWCDTDSPLDSLFYEWCSCLKRYCSKSVLLKRWELLEVINRCLEPFSTMSFSQKYVLIGLNNLEFRNFVTSQKAYCRSVLLA